MARGAYDFKKTDLGDPVWPNQTFAELLAIGFKDRVIDNRNHSIIKQMLGEL
jgi:hypothetical protein